MQVCLPWNRGASECLSYLLPEGSRATTMHDTYVSSLHGGAMDHERGGPETLVLTRDDVAALMGPEDFRQAVGEAFRRHGTGQAAAPALLGFHVEGGGFHIKVGRYEGERGDYFTAKTNANFPANPTSRGLPTVQGAIQVFDVRSGAVLAVMDSIHVTTLRTAAATAVAAAFLAHPDARVATIVGCGTQGRAHLRALSASLALEEVVVWDEDPSAAQRMARDMAGDGAPTVTTTDALRDAVRRSDVVVTCTPSTRFVIDADWVSPGTFVAGVGADSEDKRELPPALLAGSRVVVDVLEQCERIGDLHHALEAGAMVRQDVHAELGEVVAGKKPGRTSDAEVFVFDSTGMALQDAAAAVMILERARAAGRGWSVRLGGA